MTDAPTGPAPTLLLLHGLGASPGVWAGLVDRLGWPGRTAVPTLPGHGSAPWTGDYTLEALAGAVAEGCDDGEPVLIVGHSLGGAVGLELASGRYRPDVRAVIGLGIKTTWTDDDVAGMAKVAGRGVRWFDTREEAAARYLRQAGLDNILAPDDPTLTDAITTAPLPTAPPPAPTAPTASVPAAGGQESDSTPTAGRGAQGPQAGGQEGLSTQAAGQEGGGREGPWRVAQDPGTFAQLPVDMAALLAAAGCPVLLGAGEHDAMATEAELSAFVDQPRIAADRGHNVQVEDPGWVAALISETADAISAQAG